MNDINNHIEKTFSGSHYYLTTTIEIDDVPTVIEEYGYYKNGKVEYIEYVDDELEVIIKDGVKYETSDDRRIVFDNSQVKSLWELYELTSEDDEEIDTFENTDFIDYIYKQFNGYYFEVNKGVINRFIDEELNSDFRVTGKIKGDVNFSWGKLKSMTMSFQAKSNNVPIDVKVTQTFDLKKSRKVVEFPEDIQSKYWSNIETKNLDDYVADERIELLDLELPNIYKSNDKIVSYDVNNIYVYNQNFELEKTIPINEKVFMSAIIDEDEFYFNVVDGYVFIKGDNTSSSSKIYLLNIETEEWFKIEEVMTILNISPTLKIYCKTTSTKLKCIDVIASTTISLIGEYFIAEIDGIIYTCDTRSNDYENGIYQYKDGASTFITNLELVSGYVYGENILSYKYNTNYGYNGNKVFNKDLEEVATLPFNPGSISCNVGNVMILDKKYYYDIYNYENLFMPLIRLNVDMLIAFEYCYIMKKNGENKLYKVEKSFIDELGGWQ